jgi:hypothetical protein
LYWEQQPPPLAPLVQQQGMSSLTFHQRAQALLVLHKYPEVRMSLILKRHYYHQIRDFYLDKYKIGAHLWQSTQQ